MCVWYMVSTQQSSKYITKRKSYRSITKDTVDIVCELDIWRVSLSQLFIRLKSRTEQGFLTLPGLTLRYLDHAKMPRLKQKYQEQELVTNN